MAEQRVSKRKALIVVPLLLGGAVLAWWFGRPVSPDITDDIEAKANMLTQQAVQLDDERTENQVEIPDERDSRLKDMRDGDP